MVVRVPCHLPGHFVAARCCLVLVLPFEDSGGGRQQGGGRREKGGGEWVLGGIIQLLAGEKGRASGGEGYGGLNMRSLLEGGSEVS